MWTKIPNILKQLLHYSCQNGGRILLGSRRELSSIANGRRKRWTNVETKGTGVETKERAESILLGPRRLIRNLLRTRLLGPFLSSQRQSLSFQRSSIVCVSHLPLRKAPSTSDSDNLFLSSLMKLKIFIPRLWGTTSSIKSNHSH